MNSVVSKLIEFLINTYIIECGFFVCVCVCVKQDLHNSASTTVCDDGLHVLSCTDTETPQMLLLKLLPINTGELLISLPHAGLLCDIHGHVFAR